MFYCQVYWNLEMITLHFSNTNQKANPGDMTVNFPSNREKRTTYLRYLLGKILHLLRLSLSKAKGKFIFQGGKGHYTIKSPFMHLSNGFICS